MRTIRSAATVMLAAGGVVTAAGGALAAWAPAGVSAATAAVPAAPGAWHVAKTVPGPNFPLFSAVTSSSAGSAWAFEAVSGKRPVAWQLSGSVWSRRSFPGKNNESVVSASSSSARDVWAFTSSRQALHWNGRRWFTVRKFARSIGSGLAISSGDVWVFGEPFVPGAGLGSWHFNGNRWIHPASGRGLFGASALSPNSIWAYGTKNVAHWNGHVWTSTSVASLLPKNTPLQSPRLTGILAVSATSVWAVATGGRQDEGGPLVLLHFNGASWSQVALRKSLGAPEAIIGDGRGGLWIPVLTGFPGDGTIEHFSNGSLTSATLPIGPLHLAMFGAAIGKHTTAALAIGYSRTSFSASTTTAVILRFGT